MIALEYYISQSLDINNGILTTSYLIDVNKKIGIVSCGIFRKNMIALLEKSVDCEFFNYNESSSIASTIDEIKNGCVERILSQAKPFTDLIFNNPTDFDIFDSPFNKRLNKGHYIYCLDQYIFWKYYCFSYGLMGRNFIKSVEEKYDAFFSSYFSQSKFKYIDPGESLKRNLYVENSLTLNVNINDIIDKIINDNLFVIRQKYFLHPLLKTSNKYFSAYLINIFKSRALKKHHLNYLKKLAEEAGDDFYEPKYDLKAAMRDTFDALTDGSCGDYEDFDGNWDNLDDWRG